MKKILEEIEKNFLVDGCDRIIGRSESFLKVLELARLAAETDVPVFIGGESGTGKEVVADYIHKHSARAGKRILKINCVALPENLFESELFGYEAHAFTGAVKAKKGLFELADKGTIFLDEIAEVPLSLQPKLLRTLQEKEILRIGGNMPIKVDFRVIAASNKDLKKMVADGRFREDLYYRLNVVELKIPPLRERREDLSLLINYFVKVFSKKYDKHILGFEKNALECLESYPWPGNVREVRNLVERLMIFEKSGYISSRHFPSDLCSRARACRSGSCSPKTGKPSLGPVDDYEKRLIENALAEFGGSRTRAAEKLGMHRNTISRKIAEYGIDVKNLC